MASVQYLGNGKFRVTYTDFKASQQQGRRIQRQKTEYALDKDGKRITQDVGLSRVIKARAAALLEEARRAERISKGETLPQADLKLPRKTDEKSLLHYLNTVVMNRPCLSGNPKSVSHAIARVKQLAAWVEANYPEVTPQDFTKAQAEEFLKSVSGYSKNTLETLSKILKGAWNRLAEHFEDKKIQLGNPWKRAAHPKNLTAIAKHKQSIKSSGYTKEWLAAFFKHLSSLDKPNRAEIYGFFYLAAVTGWRREDVRELTWANVNFEKRYMFCNHGKVENRTAARTVIFLTDGLVEVLKSLPLDHPHRRLFNVGADVLTAVLRDYIKENPPALYEEDNTGKYGKYARRSHTMHGFRKSVATHLTTAQFGDAVGYLLGLAPKGIQQKHYEKFEMDIEGGTRPMIEYMESVIKGTIAERDSVMDKLKAAGVSLEDLKSLLGASSGLE